MTALFYTRIVNLVADSYLNMVPEKVLEKAEEENNSKYLQPYLEISCHFTMIVYYSYGIPRSEAKDTHQHMDLHTRYNMKQEYVEMCRLVGANMAIEIVPSSTLLPRVPGDK